jgi:Ca2+-binding EF-hand superfamily protein
MPKKKPFVPNVAARKAMDENQIDEFKEAFRVFDTDHGGTIDAEEYSNLMSMLGMSNDVSRLTEMFVAMDQDEDGELQFEEFLILMATLMHEEDNTDGMVEAFERIDENGTGYISVDVIKQIFEGIAENCSDSEVENLLANIDTDQDGLVSVVDLQRFLGMELIPRRVQVIEEEEEDEETFEQGKRRVLHEHEKMVGIKKVTSIVHEI